MQIRNSLGPFNYDPEPKSDGAKRMKRPQITLDNGAQYEGDWDELNRKDGKGA